MSILNGHALHSVWCLSNSEWSLTFIWPSYSFCMGSCKPWNDITTNNNITTNNELSNYSIELSVQMGVSLQFFPDTTTTTFAGTGIGNIPWLSNDSFTIRERESSWQINITV